MTGEECGLPIKDTPQNILAMKAALEWMLNNTTLTFDTTNIEEIKALPSGARLFILKFVDIMSMGTGVTSESIAGMSQSFDTSSQKMLIMRYAAELLGGYMKSSLQVNQASNRWV